MSIATKNGPTAATIRRAVYAAISKAEPEGIPRSRLNKGCVEGRRFTRAMLDVAVASLTEAGRIVAHGSDEGSLGRPRTVYRLAGISEREAWFQSELKRRGLDRPRGIRVEGRCR